MSFWRSFLNPRMLMNLVTVSRSGRATYAVWNSHRQSQCLPLLLTLCLDFSILRGNPSRWSAVLQLTSCLTNTASHVSLVTCIAQPFHIVDLYLGKLQFRWWLELIITLFANFPRIRLLDDWTHSFNQPVTIHTALGTLDA